MATAARKVVWQMPSKKRLTGTSKAELGAVLKRYGLWRALTIKRKAHRILRRQRDRNTFALAVEAGVACTETFQ